MGNSICHIEIPCEDLNRAKEFYGDVFNWTFEDSTDTYSSFSTGNGVGGGLEVRGEKIPIGRGITIYIEVDDIPRYLEKIREYKCSVVQEKTKISEEFGFYGLFADTEGNILGLWSRE
jgi:predicted enzyme related to lactoylglutathione lyase